MKWIHLSSKNGGIPGLGPSKDQTSTLVIDVDKNGVNDFIIANREQGPSVSWFRRNVNGWTKYLIDSSFLNIGVGGVSLDIDGDGDLDIIFGADAEDNKIWWWENPYPIFDPNIPWMRREIKNIGKSQHHDQIAGDFNGDGKPDLVFWNQKAKKLFIAQIPRDPRHTSSWQYVEIFSWDSGMCEGLAKMDIDGDGKLDIVGCGRWFKHDVENLYIPNIIDETQMFSRAAVGQLKKGGRPEVVFVIGDGSGRLKWYEWKGNKWVGHDLLGVDVTHGHSLAVVDIDGDGNLDIFCAEMRQWNKSTDDNPNAKMWIFWGDGKGNFKKGEIATGYDSHETRVADLDGDGDLDLLIKPFIWDVPRVDVWLNNGLDYEKKKLSLDKWQRHLVDPDRPWRSVFIEGSDMDDDGKKDIVTGGWWYKNPGRVDGYWERHIIGSPLNNLAIVYDFDGDGDQDVLGTEGKGSEANANFVWARNNGKGSFATFNNIEKAKGDFLQGVAAAPFKNLARIEVALSWHKAGHGVQLLTVPPDPSQGVWTWRKISDESQDEQLSIGDIDRNGTIDLLLGIRWLCSDCPLSRASWLRWFFLRYPRWADALDRRLGSGWLKWRLQSIDEATGDPDRNRLADINGDGRLDAVVGFEAISVPGDLVWYEQPGSIASEWKKHTIAKVIGPMSLDVADMDSDGDFDIIAGEHNLKDPSSAKLFIFENTDGKGISWVPHIVYTGDEHHDGAIVVDIDDDGDLDVLSIGWGHNKVVLYENKAIDQ